MRPRMPNTATTDAAMSRPIGCATNNGGWTRSAPPRPHWKPRPRRRPKPRRHCRSAIAAGEANTGRKPTEISGDAGFCSEANLAELAACNIAAYLATGRASHPAGAAAAPKGGPLVQAMRAKLKRAGHRSRYRLRKQIVEPVFGQIKQARGFRQFLLRGIDKVAAEWALVCTPHNLTKLAAAA